MVVLVPAAQADDPVLPPSVALVADGLAAVSSADLRVDAANLDAADLGAVPIRAAGFLPGSVVTFGWDDAPGVLGSAIAGSTGVAVLASQIPQERAAAHLLRTEGVGLFGEQRVLQQMVDGAVAAVGAAVVAGGAGQPGRILAFVAIGLLFGLWLLLADPIRARVRAVRGGAHR